MLRGFGMILTALTLIGFLAGLKKGFVINAGKKRIRFNLADAFHIEDIEEKE